MSYWPLTAAHVAVLLSLYQSAPPLVVTVIEPLAATLVTDDTPDVTWEISSGTQTTRRVRVFSPDGLTQIFNSGPTATPSGTLTVTGGLLHTGITDYILRIEIENDEGLIGISLSTFSTMFQPSVPVSGVRVSPVGDKCRMGEVAELPGVDVRWTQVVPGVGESFTSYTVQRRPAGTAAWETAKIITDITTTRYTDYGFQPNTLYEYSVIWEAQNGGEIFRSLPVSPVQTVRVDFDWTFLHDSIDPRNWVLFYSLEADEQVQNERAFERLWGREQPTLFVGEAEYGVYSITGLPDQYSGDTWSATRGLFARQRDAGSTIVLRNGKAGIIKWCSFSRLSRSMGQEQYEAKVELIETFYDATLATT